LGLATARPGTPSQSAMLGGVVRDPTGAALSGVEVTVEGAHLMGARRQTTGERGTFSFAEIPPGRYRLTFALAGFQTLVREDLVAEAARTTFLPVTLQVAARAETVTVFGRSPIVDPKESGTETHLDRALLENVPNGRSLWSALEQTPGIVLDRYDVGGSESGQQSLFSAAGASWTQTQYSLNGVNATDPQALGASALYYAYDGFEEIQISVAGHPPEVQAPGVYLNLVLKKGADRLKGGGAYYFENQRLQNDNLNDALRAQGVPQSNPLKRYFDYSLELGGPLVKDRASFYAQLAGQTVEPFVIGFFLPSGEPGTDPTDLDHQILRGSFQLSSANELSALYLRNGKKRPYRDAGRTRPTPETALYQDSTTQIFQALYTRTLSATALLDARFSVMDLYFPLGERPDLPAEAFARFDLATGVWSEAPGQRTLFERRRWQWNATLSHFAPDWLSASHDLKWGLEAGIHPVRTSDDRNGGIVYRDRFGLPVQVELYSDPNVVSNRTANLGIFFQDTMSLQRLTLSLGLRFDRFTAGYPAQSKPPGRWDALFLARGLAPAIEGQSQVVALDAFSPRLGLSFLLGGRRPTVLRANYSRYAAQLGTSVADFGNPGGVAAALYSFSDRNGNRLLDPGEFDPGSPLALALPTRNRIDPDLAFPTTEEVSVGLEREIADDFAVNATFLYRRERNLIDDRNVGVVDTDFTPVTARDPGPDLVAGTADDRRLTVYNQSSRTLGNDVFLLTNPDSLSGDYRGLWLSARKRISRRWQMLASLAIGQANGYLPGPGGEQNEGSNFTSPLFDNPNANLNSKGRTFWDRTFVFRLSGSYQLFRGLALGVSARAQTGQPRYRSILVSESIDGVPLNQGAIEIIADPPGAPRTPAIWTLDLRGEKSFHLGRFGQLTALFDVFNLANANRPTEIGNRRGLYGAIFEILPPRVARIGIRYRF
jgi:hypothetical protein